MALSLPLVLGLCDWFQKRRFSTRLLLEKIPFIVLLAPVAWVTYSFHMRVPGKSLYEAVLIWTWTLTFYFKKFFFPFDIYPAYSIPQPVSLLEPAYFSAVAILFLLAGCLYWLRKDRWFIFACLYFYASIFFLLRYDDFMYVHPVADRFMYLPSLGFCLWLGGVGVQAFNRAGKTGKHVALAACFLVLSFLGVKTFQQAQLWGREIDLWTYVLKREPKSFFAYNSRGNLYADKKDYQAAISDFSNSIQYRPDYTPAYVNRGLVYFDLGQNELALKDFEVSLQHSNPNPDYTLVNRGLVYLKMDQKDLALKDFNEAIALNPFNAYAYHNRGGIYFKQSQPDLAIADFNKALELKKDMVKTYVSRGDAYLMKNAFDLALRDYNMALRYNPRDARTTYNRSFVYYNQKKFDAALEDALKARSLGFKVRDDYLEYLRNSLKK